MTRTKLLAVAKPILFNTEMVRAILDGRKTMTRRVIKVKAPYGQWQLEKCDHYRDQKYIDNLPEGVTASKGFLTYGPFGGYVPHKEPPYKIGDILYVRESWRSGWCEHFFYKADDETEKSTGYSIKLKWRPSIHMPKEAARIFLRVKNVRAERLQDITEEQAIKEGVLTVPERDKIIIHDYNGNGHRTGFALLWDSTIPKKNLDLYGWNANPWVWVYEFERISEDI